MRTVQTPIESIVMPCALRTLVMFLTMLLLAFAPAAGHAQSMPEGPPAIHRRRAEIEQALERLANDPAVAALVEKALTDGDPTIRLAAVGVIGSWVQPGSFSMSSESCRIDESGWEPPQIARLAEAAKSRLNDPDPKVRAAAVSVLNGRELMPQQMRAACIGGARRAMRVEARHGYLSNDTVQRLRALVSDPDREVRSVVLWALLSGSPVDDPFLDLLFEAAKDRDADVRSGWYVGMQRIGADAERAVAVAERLAMAPVPTRREGCNSVASWEAEKQVLDSLQAWDAQELDAATKACLGEVVARHKQQLAYLKANAPAIARVRALESLVDTLTDVADAAPQVRQALRDPDLLVRVAGLRLVVDWTVGELEFDIETPQSFEGLGLPALRTLTLDDFGAEIAALMNDPEPGIQGVALELFSKADLIRHLAPRLDDADTGRSVEMPTLSPPVVTRLSSVPATADPFVRQVAARTLLRYAPVDHAHIDRVCEGLTSADTEVAEEAFSSILRLRLDQSLLTTFISRMQRLTPSARRQAVRGVAGLVLEEGGRDRLEAWAKDEGESPLGRDLRALLDETGRER